MIYLIGFRLNKTNDKYQIYTNIFTWHIHHNNITYFLIEKYIMLYLDYLKMKLQFFRSTGMLLINIILHKIVPYLTSFLMCFRYSTQPACGNKRPFICHTYREINAPYLYSSLSTL